MRLWHSTTYRLEATLNYLLERCWSITAPHKAGQASNVVAIGYDQGSVVIKLGSDQPVVGEKRFF